MALQGFYPRILDWGLDRFLGVSHFLGFNILMLQEKQQTINRMDMEMKRE